MQQPYQLSHDRSGRSRLTPSGSSPQSLGASPTSAIKVPAASDGEAVERKPTVAPTVSFADDAVLASPDAADFPDIGVAERSRARALCDYAAAVDEARAARPSEAGDEGGGAGEASAIEEQEVAGASIIEEDGTETVVEHDDDEDGDRHVGEAHDEAEYCMAEKPKDEQTPQSEKRRGNESPKSEPTAPSSSMEEDRERPEMSVVMDTSALDVTFASTNTRTFDRILSAARKHPKQFLKWQEKLSRSGKGRGDDDPVPTAADIEAARRWKSVFDKSLSKVYYYHVGTREVSWDKPLGYDEAHAEKVVGGSVGGEEKKGGGAAANEVCSDDRKSDDDDDDDDDDDEDDNEAQGQQPADQDAGRDVVKQYKSSFLTPPQGVRSFTPLHWEILRSDTNVSALTGILSARESFAKGGKGGGSPTKGGYEMRGMRRRRGKRRSSRGKSLGDKSRSRSKSRNRKSHSHGKKHGGKGRSHSEGHRKRGPERDKNRKGEGRATDDDVPSDEEEEVEVTLPPEAACEEGHEESTIDVVELPPQPSLDDVIVAAASDLEHQRSLDIVDDIARYEEEILQAEREGAATPELLPPKEQETRQISFNADAAEANGDSADGIVGKGARLSSLVKNKLKSSVHVLTPPTLKKEGNEQQTHSNDDADERGVKLSSLVKSKLKPSRTKHQEDSARDVDEAQRIPSDADAAPHGEDVEGAAIEGRVGKLSMLVKSKLKSSRLRHEEEPAASKNNDKEQQIPSDDNAVREDGGAVAVEGRGGKLSTLVKSKLKSSRLRNEQELAVSKDGRVRKIPPDSVAARLGDDSDGAAVEGGGGKLSTLVKSKLKLSRSRHEKEPTVSKGNEARKIPPNAARPGEDGEVAAIEGRGIKPSSLVKNETKSIRSRHEGEPPTSDEKEAQSSPGDANDGDGNGKLSSLVKIKFKSSRRFLVDKISGETVKERSSPAHVQQSPQEQPPEECFIKEPIVRIELEESEIELTYGMPPPIRPSKPTEHSTREEPSEECPMPPFVLNRHAKISFSDSEEDDVPMAEGMSPATNESEVVARSESHHADLDEVLLDTIMLRDVYPRDVPNPEQGRGSDGTLLAPLREEEGPCGRRPCPSEACANHADLDELLWDVITCHDDDPYDVPDSEDERGFAMEANACAAPSARAAVELSRMESKHADLDEVMIDAIAHGICRSDPQQNERDETSGSTFNRGLIRGLAKSRSVPAAGRGVSHVESRCYSKLVLEEESEIGLTYDSLSTLPTTNPRFPGSIPGTPVTPAAGRARRVISELSPSPAREGGRKRGGLFKRVFVCDAVPLHACCDSSPDKYGKNNVGCGGSTATKTCSTLSWGGISDESTLAAENQYEDDQVVRIGSYASQRQRQRGEDLNGEAGEGTDGGTPPENGKDDDDDTLAFLNNNGARRKFMKRLKSVGGGMSTKRAHEIQEVGDEDQYETDSDNTKVGHSADNEDNVACGDRDAEKENNGISKHWKAALNNTLNTSKKKPKELPLIEPPGSDESIYEETDANQSLNIEWTEQDSKGNSIRKKLSKRLIAVSGRIEKNISDTTGRARGIDSGASNTETGSLAAKKQKKEFKPLKEQTAEEFRYGDVVAKDDLCESSIEENPVVDENSIVEKKARSNKPSKGGRVEQSKMDHLTEEMAEDKTTTEEKLGFEENSAAAPKVEEKVSIDDDIGKYWRTATDGGTGKTYYYNKKTKEVTWTKPPSAL